MKKIWKPALLLAAIAIMAYGVIGSGAWFTDTATGDVATISSGTLSIDDGKVVEVPLVEITNVEPGWVSDEVVVKIVNNGSINLAWFGDLVIEGGGILNEALYIDYAKMEFVGWTELPDEFIVDGIGAGLYPTWFNQLAALSPFGVVTLKNFDGNDGMLPGTAYEFMGALIPTNSYKLTLKFGMAELAGNEYQNLGPLTIKFKVDATQVKEGAMLALTGLSGIDLPWFNTQITNQLAP
jgi:hypothetical protein